MSKHSKFIKTPIFNILQECVLACNGLDDNIETQPLHEYIMQSVFLKMTGASEQKLKCICWEMATEDYEYRYDFLNKKKYGECSKYDDKSKIYKDIIEQIKKFNSNFDIEKLIDNKEEFIKNIKENITILIENSIISKWLERDFAFFKSKNGSGNVKATQICNPSNLLENLLQSDFEKYVYNHRNRCAHNLRSCQENLPTLSTLADEYQNYFYRFYILILLDEIFMKLYDEYLKAIEN